MCAKLATTALEESSRDCRNECKTLCTEYKPHIQEDWLEQAWEFEGNIYVDKRNEHIDKRMAYATTRNVAPYGDGSYKE